MDGFSKTGRKTRKIFPFDPECTTYMYLTLGRALFFAKKRKKCNEKSQKVLFSFLISKCIDSFCHECRIPRWKKNPKEKLNGSLRVEKQKTKKSFIFIFLNYCHFHYICDRIYKSLPIFSKNFCTNNKKWGCISQLTQCGDKIWNFVLTL